MALPVFWGGLVAGPTADVFEGFADSVVTLTVAARLEGLGVAPPVPFSVVLDGPGYVGESRVDQGLAHFEIHRGAPGSAEFHVVDGAPCGLPVVEAEPITVAWKTQEVASSAPPTISLPTLDDWIRSAPFTLPVEASSPFEWRIGGTNMSWRAPPVVLDSGVHRVEARLLGGDGDAQSGRVATALVRVDATAPVVAEAFLRTQGEDVPQNVDAPSFEIADGVWRQDATIRWIVTDAVAGLDLSSIRLEVDGTPHDVEITPEDFAPGGGRARASLTARLSDGTHALGVTLKDAAGHATSWVGRVAIDTKQPTLALETEPTEPGAKGWWTRAVTVTAQASDNGSGLSRKVVLVDGVEAQGTAPLTLDGESVRTVTILATDRAGNEARLERTFNLDTVAPHLHLPDSLPSNATEFRFSVDEHGSGLGTVAFATPMDAFPNAISYELREGGTYDVVVNLTGWTGHTMALTLSDRAGNVAGGVIQVAVAEPEVAAPGVRFTIQALVVSPSEPEPADDVRVTASVSGIRGGTLALVDKMGQRHDLGVATVIDGRLVASGRAPGPGDYDVVLFLEADDGSPLEHRDGRVSIKASARSTGPGGLQNAAPSPVPSAPVVAGVLVIALAALAWARAAHPSRKSESKNR